jgi:hypothetical protein
VSATTHRHAYGPVHAVAGVTGSVGSEVVLPENDVRRLIVVQEVVPDEDPVVVSIRDRQVDAVTGDPALVIECQRPAGVIEIEARGHYVGSLPSDEWLDRSGGGHRVGEGHGLNRDLAGPQRGAGSRPLAVISGLRAGWLAIAVGIAANALRAWGRLIGEWGKLLCGRCVGQTGFREGFAAGGAGGGNQQDGNPQPKERQPCPE